MSSDRTAVEGRRSLRELHRENAKLNRRLGITTGQPIERPSPDTRHVRPKGGDSNR